jgi:hypothetical protein
MPDWRGRHRYLDALCLNYSCNANKKLQQYSVGDKVLMRVRVEGGKNVGFGEVLTVNDGGEKYLMGQRIACRYGNDCRQLWSERRIGNNKKTLGGARKEGAAPDWTRSLSKLDMPSSKAWT